jgi:hypothetical protein
MSLLGSRLGGQLTTDYYNALKAAFPVDASLLPAEQTGINTSLENFATAMGSTAGPDVVAEITGNAAVPGAGLVAPDGAVTGATTVT